MKAGSLWTMYEMHGKKLSRNFVFIFLPIATGRLYPVQILDA
ncbi:hypothetical protein [Alkalibacterium kapii]|uniref:Uncharacterized protein n=1 Tax=Alkalibacterium kapii TaxID=426704 RepID=A0A511AW90_9LACT|nr:hypothetical protein [Alkalibacterium kapii]GEK91902.1 hypothetical protein AKA01nite_15240 [Alkalibacterium kapii]